MTVTPQNLGKKLAYQVRTAEKDALELEEEGRWPDNAAAQADDLVLAALDKLYDPTDGNRIANARKALIRAHTHLLIAAQRERS